MSDKPLTEYTVEERLDLVERQNSFLKTELDVIVSRNEQLEEMLGDMQRELNYMAAMIESLQYRR